MGSSLPRRAARHRHLNSLRTGLLNFLQEPGVNTGFQNSKLRTVLSTATFPCGIGYLSDLYSSDNYLRVCHTASLRTSISLPVREEVVSPWLSAGLRDERK